MTQPNRLTLYHYWRSSCSWRVRWAMNLKRVRPELVAIDLLNGEVEGEAHRARNPLGYVPVLDLHPDAETSGASAPRFRYLGESMAIIQWLDETHPEPPLMPGDALMRARTRQLLEIINADTQPLQNINPQELHSSDAAARKAWVQHWIRNGIGAYEKLVRETAGIFSVGDSPTLADICLIPQFYNVIRYEIPVENFPICNRIYEHALKTPECAAAHPDRYKPAS